ncbi:hypothetical protein D9M71_636790 [compost metagenome]
MLALEDHRLLAERGLGVGDVIHAEPGRHRHHGNEWNPDQAGILQPQLGAVGKLLRFAAKAAEQPANNRQRHGELHHRDTEIAQAGVQAERGALLVLRIEEADVGHARSEVAATKTTEQRDGREHPVGSGRVLHREAQPQAGNQQRGGG